MRRAVLLFNPASGRRSSRRLLVIEKVATALRARGLDVEAITTEAPGTAGRQAAEACESGADIVFACGGDGTVHEVLQGMVFQSTAALGVLPLGTANAMARHLRLSLDPVRAALQQLHYQPALIHVGKVTYQSRTGEASRYFSVMAGAGPDGALVYRMLAGGKHRLGRATYYLRAAQLFARTPFSDFTVTATSAEAVLTEHQAVSAMAVRVGDLGGLFSPLVRGASLQDPQILLVTALTPAYLSLPAWFAMSWARLHRWNRFARSERVSNFTSGAGATSPVHVQADGEWLGHTPMSVTLIPHALRLLLPPAPKA